MEILIRDLEMAKIGYIRVSTDKQLIDRQLDSLKDCCDQVFVEYGVSAVSKKRPVYDEVMKTLVEGDIFVVCSLDRAFRSVTDALNELDSLHKVGIQFLSLSQDFDTTTPHGKLLYTLTAALAEWEREVLSQRTKEGMQAARRKGKQIGRPRKLKDRDLVEAKRLLNAAIPLADAALKLRVHEKTLKRALNIS